MSFDRKGEDFFISGSVSAVSFYGDGSNLTGISGGGGGGLTGSGTTNYIAKFTSAGVLGDSNIQDLGYPNGVGINYAPQTGTLLAASTAQQPKTFFIQNNYATSSTTTVAQMWNIGPGTGSHIGLDIFVNAGTENYGLKIDDGRQAVGKVLTSDASGNGYWATPTGGSGATPSLAQVLSVGATASTSIDMMQYSLSNVLVIDADGDVGIKTINMINASLLTLMYNT